MGPRLNEFGGWIAAGAGDRVLGLAVIAAGAGTRS